MNTDYLYGLLTSKGFSFSKIVIHNEFDLWVCSWKSFFRNNEFLKVSCCNSDLKKCTTICFNKIIWLTYCKVLSCKSFYSGNPCLFEPKAMIDDFDITDKRELCSYLLNNNLYNMVFSDVGNELCNSIVSLGYKVTYLALSKSICITKISDFKGHTAYSCSKGRNLDDALLKGIYNIISSVFFVPGRYFKNIPFRDFLFNESSYFTSFENDDSLFFLNSSFDNQTISIDSYCSEEFNCLRLASDFRFLNKGDPLFKQQALVLFDNHDIFCFDEFKIIKTFISMFIWIRSIPCSDYFSLNNAIKSGHIFDYKISENDVRLISDFDYCLSRFIVDPYFNCVKDLISI